MTSEDERAFYESLLQISWLAPEVRRAVFKVLGRSYRAAKADFNHGWAVGVRYLIKEEKARMRKAGELPRGGVHEAAVVKVAGWQGVAVATLKKRLQRANGR